MKIIRENFSRLRRSQAQFGLALVATISALLGAALGQFFQEGRYIAVVVVLVVLFVVSARWGQNAIRRALSPTTAYIEHSDKAPKSKAVILTVSMLRDFDKPDSVHRRCYDAAMEKVSRAKDSGALSAVLDELCDPRRSPFNEWPWQQSLRVVRHNIPDLKLACVILSTQIEAKNLYEPFTLLLRPFLAPDAEVVRVAPPVELSDYNQVSRAIGQAFAFCERHGCKPSEICIDITSGTAAYSAAAAVRTLNSELMFSYVQTRGPNEGQISIYHATIAN